MKTLNDMEKQTKEIKFDLLKICWYMRGGVTYDEANAMSPQEREIIGNLVKYCDTFGHMAFPIFTVHALNVT